MGYNDSPGDHHEQSNLLGGQGKLLSDDFKQLFGDATIRHSDFRADNIKGVKITVRGPENYTEFVNNHPDLTQTFAEETSRSIEQFGKDEWREYVNVKSGVPTSAVEREMAYDNVISEHMWLAPLYDPATNAPQTGFNPPVSVPVEFGQSVEFEVVYSGGREKFNNFRRYMSNNYSWDMSRSVSTGADAIDNPVALPTTNGCDAQSHAFQARYQFATPHFEEGAVFQVREII